MPSFAHGYPTLQVLFSHLGKRKLEEDGLEIVEDPNMPGPSKVPVNKRGPSKLPPSKSGPSKQPPNKPGPSKLPSAYW